MSVIMVCFGDLPSSQPNLLKALTLYLLEVIMKDKEWPQGFQKWSPEEGNWGYISWGESPQPVVPGEVHVLMDKYLFRHSTTPWGTSRYDLKLDEMDDSVLKVLHSRVIVDEKQKAETEEKAETEGYKEAIYAYLRSVGAETPAEKCRVLRELLSGARQTLATLSMIDCIGIRHS
jgi:hypothetical protein